MELPLHAVESLEAESVRLKGGNAVGVVRLAGAGQKAAVLLVDREGRGPEVLWTGQLVLKGDPGERRADALEIGDRDGDGQPDVVVGTYDEQVQICGSARSLLGPRAIDPKSLTLRSVLLNRDPARALTAQLNASADAPSVHTPPMLQALRATSASSAAPAPEHAAAALSDGDPATSWVDGRGLGGRFEFVTLRWAAPSHPIRHLAVIPVAAGQSSHEPSARVRGLSLLGPAGERLAVSLPADPKPGQRYWITPKQPLAWSCLTLLVDRVDGEPLSPQTHTGLAELEAYTELDEGAGLAQLVAELGQPGARGDEATGLLQQASGDRIEALAQAWPTLPSVGKRRALRLLFQSSRTPDLRTQELLRQALHDPDKEVSEPAFKLASESASFGPALLASLAHSPTSQGDRALKVIAHSHAPGAFDTLLGILAEPGGSERAALREALAVAYRAAPTEAAASVARWFDAVDAKAGSSAAALPAGIALVRALAATPEAQPEMSRRLVPLLGEAHEFPEQWQLVQAAALLPNEPQANAWLAQLTSAASTWMLRSSALEALARRDPAGALPLAERALADTYPRVRATAVGLLARASHELGSLQKAAKDDEWFLVRKAALDNLPDTKETRASLEDALGDRAAIVRASAIQNLRRLGATDAWPKIQPLLENKNQYPEVIAEGIGFVHGLCVHAAIPTLRAIASRGLQPNAWNADQELAYSALEALSAFGGDAGTWAREHALNPVVARDLQLAAAGSASSCQKRTAP